MRFASPSPTSLRRLLVALCLLHWPRVADYANAEQHTVVNALSQLVDAGNDPHAGDNDVIAAQQMPKDDACEPHSEHYTAEWVVRVKGGKEVADRVALENGYENVRQVSKKK